MNVVAVMRLDVKGVTDQEIFDVNNVTVMDGSCVTSVKKKSDMKNFKQFALMLEKLKMSDEIFELIYNSSYPVDEPAYKISKFLLSLSNHDLYKDSENVNMIHLGEEMNKFCFTPLNKRRDEESDLKTGMMPTRIGRLINKIWQNSKNFLNFTYSGNVGFIKSHRPGNIIIINLDLNLKDHFLFSVDDVITILFTIGDTEVKGLVKDTSAKTVIVILDDENYSKLKETLGSPLNDAKQVSNVLIKIKSNFEITDSDIEDFVNKSVAFIRTNRVTIDSKIRVVKGEEIRYWYLYDNYASIRGELGNSCMASEEAQEYLDIYCRNESKVSLIIITNSDNLLISRALLWKLDDGSYLVDRIYSSITSNDHIIINWARNMGYHYKSRDGHIVSNNKRSESESFSVTLDEWDFVYYPYLDTLRILNMDTGVLSDTISFSGREIKLSDTDGGYSGI